jgi:spermidine dehydrogenase
VPAGVPAREQHRAGRVELLTMTLDTFERHVREQLTRMLAAVDSTRPVTSWRSR